MKSSKLRERVAELEAADAANQARIKQLENEVAEQRSAARRKANEAWGAKITDALGADFVAAQGDLEIKYGSPEPLASSWAFYGSRYQYPTTLLTVKFKGPDEALARLARAFAARPKP